MKKSVNLNGTTKQGRAKATKQAFSAKSLLETMRRLGMTDEEIKAKLQQKGGCKDNNEPTTS